MPPRVIPIFHPILVYFSMCCVHRFEGPDYVVVAPHLSSSNYLSWSIKKFDIQSRIPLVMVSESVVGIGVIYLQMDIIRG